MCAILLLIVPFALTLGCSEFKRTKDLAASGDVTAQYNLAVLFYQAYLHELRGNLGDAAQIYRKILDEDHRYRFVIQRLGLVQ